MLNIVEKGDNTVLNLFATMAVLINLDMTWLLFMENVPTNIYHLLKLTNDFMFS
jgi:hypothetical protein